MTFNFNEWSKKWKKQPQFNPEDKESRKCGFGATDVVALMGYQKNRTPNMVLDEKRGIREPDDLSENWHVKWGIYDEATIKRIARVEWDWDIRDTHQTYWKGFIYAHLDGLINISETSYGLEVKSRESFMKHQYGEEETDQILKSEMIQIQTMLMITGLPAFKLLVRCGKEPLKVFHVEPEFQIQQAITEKVGDSIKCLMNGSYLDVIESKDTDYIFKEGGNDKEYIEVTPDIEYELEHWKLANQDLKEYQEAVDHWKTKIKKRIGDKYGIKDSEGNTRVVWAKRKKGRAIIPYFNTPSGSTNE